MANSPGLVTSPCRRLHVLLSEFGNFGQTWFWSWNRIIAQLENVPLDFAVLYPISRSSTKSQSPHNGVKYTSNVADRIQESTKTLRDEYRNRTFLMSVLLWLVSSSRGESSDMETVTAAAPRPSESVPILLPENGRRMGEWLRLTESIWFSDLRVHRVWTLSQKIIAHVSDLQGVHRQPAVCVLPCPTLQIAWCGLRHVHRLTRWTRPLQRFLNFLRTPVCLFAY